MLVSSGTAEAAGTSSASTRPATQPSRKCTSPRLASSVRPPSKIVCQLAGSHWREGQAGCEGTEPAQGAMQPPSLTAGRACHEWALPRPIIMLWSRRSGCNTDVL